MTKSARLDLIKARHQAKRKPRLSWLDRMVRNRRNQDLIEFLNWLDRKTSGAANGRSP